MKSKTKKIIQKIPTILAALVIVMGAGMKLAGAPELVDIYSRIGLLPFMKILAITEVLFVALFTWQRTMKLGLLLLTGYFGGAMAVELSHGNFFIFPAVILSVVWIAAYLRDGSLFKTGAVYTPSAS